MLKSIASSNLEQVRPSAFALFLAIGEQKWLEMPSKGLFRQAMAFQPIFWVHTGTCV